MRVSNRIDIPMDALAKLCRRYHVCELTLFGSVLRDDVRDDSDIDMLVEYEPDARVTVFDHFDLRRELESLIGRPVDLVPKDGLRPILRESVLSTSEVIYSSVSTWTLAISSMPVMRSRGMSPTSIGNRS